MRTKNESPNRVAAQSGDSSFLFTVAKHPPGYLLPLSFLSSHLQIRWQTRPAATVTKKESTASTKTPPPAAGYRLGNAENIPYIPVNFYIYFTDHGARSCRASLLPCFALFSIFVTMPRRYRTVSQIDTRSHQPYLKNLATKG